MNKVKRVAAIIGIVLIASMYLISFISAIFAGKYTGGLFLASVFSTIVIPIIIWWFLAMYRWFHGEDKSHQEYPQQPEDDFKSSNDDDLNPDTDGDFEFDENEESDADSDESESDRS